MGALATQALSYGMTDPLDDNFDNTAFFILNCIVERVILNGEKP